MSAQLHICYLLVCLFQNCFQKMAVLQPQRHQVIYLSVSHQFSGCVLNSTDAAAPFYRCRNSRKFSSSRARWWYIVLADCDSTKVIDFVKSMACVLVVMCESISISCFFVCMFLHCFASISICNLTSEISVPRSK